MLSVGRNDPCPCGSGQKYKKCCADKELATGILPKTSADNSQSRVLLGQGIELVQKGQIPAGLAKAKQAYDASPDNEEIAWGYGSLLSQNGQPDAAESVLAHGVKKHPQSVRLYLSLAGTFESRHQNDKALDILREASKLMPSNPDLYYWIGYCLLSQGLVSQAIENLEKANSLYATANKDTLEQLYYAHKKMGKEEECARIYQEIKKHFPESTIRENCLFVMAEVLSSDEEAVTIRQNIKNVLAEANVSSAPIKKPLTSLKTPPFMLAFHNRDDVKLMQDCAAMFRKRCPELSFVAPHCKPGVWQPPVGRRLRLGFVSQYFYNHSVGLYLNQQIASIMQNGQFEGFMFVGGGMQDETFSNLSKHMQHVIPLPIFLEQACQLIAQAQLDILVYLDVGMNNASYFMPFCRLAPIQCVLAGHPVTTGIDTMDYFISSSLCEPDIAQEHYSETLIKTKQFTGRGDRMSIPPSNKTLADFGLPEERHIYYVPASLQKIHPDFDAAARDILEKDPKAIIAYPSMSTQERIMATLTARLKQNLGPHYERAHFLPWLNTADFLRMLSLADVVIDPYYFGLASTLYQIGEVGTPFVTLPGEYMRNRIGLGVTTLLDMPELVAKNHGDFVEKAIRIASDASYRSQLKEKLLANNDVLYGDNGVGVVLAHNFAALPQYHYEHKLKLAS